MGKRGPAPTPIPIRRREGNPSKRQLPEERAKSRPATPSCPEWLSVEAKEEWRRVVPELERLGFLIPEAMAALEIYCETYAQWRRAVKSLKRRLVMKMRTESGSVYQQQLPQVSIAFKAAQVVKAYCGLFGLTPSDRGRMALPPAPPQEDCRVCGLSQSMCGCG